MTDQSNWPQWLRDADTRNALVEVTSSGRVTWLDGVWLDGVWRDGEWCNGEWLDGEWLDGVWLDGVWLDGVWRGGVWRDGAWRGGVWHGGEWCGGVWHGGVWHGGEWCGGWRTCNQASWTVVSNGDGFVRFGCQEMTVEKALAIAEGRTKAPAGAPGPDTREAQMLRASLKAMIAYDEEMAKWSEG